MGGIGYGLTRAGVAGAIMIANAALSTDVGITASLYGGAIAAAAKAGIQNSTLMLNAIQSMPGGNMMLMYGPKIHNFTCGFIEGFTPSGPIGSNILSENIGWLGGWTTSKLLE